MLLHAMILAFTLTSEPEATKVQPHPLDRVAVIGASLTWGYGAHMPFRTPTYTHRELVTFPDVLEASLDDEYDLAHQGSDILFFQRPMRTGPELVANAKAAEPTLLIAVDFLFWFGYGERDKHGRLHADTASRLALLEQGLDQLATFECPIVISDYPDMRPAIGRILKPTHVPSPEALTVLNARLREWADERSNVQVIPLSKVVQQLQQGSGFSVEELDFTDEDAEAMLQQDQLHPTTAGTLVIAQLVLRAIDAQLDAVDTDDYVRNPEVARQRLIELLQQRLDPALQAEPLPED